MNNFEWHDQVGIIIPFLQISLNIHYVAAPYKITDQVKKIPVLITHQIQFLRIFGA